MSSEIAGAVAGIRLLMDFIKANKTLANYNELVAAVSEVNAELISSQAATIASQKSEMTLTKRVSELEQKIMTLENWEREAERYQLTNLAPGIPTRTLKPGMEQGETPHPLCANCFSNHKKSFLQYNPPANRGRMTCARCKGEWYPDFRQRPRHTVEEIDDASVDPKTGMPRY